jgi:ubiquinone/menaquinone biosynthesis C-methylase UbiE
MADRAFPLSKLEQLPLDLRADAIEAAIEPFRIADTNVDRRWEALTAKRRKTALRRLARRFLGGWLGSGRRDRDSIETEYTEAWSAGHQKYDPSRAEMRAQPWLWGRRRLLLDGGAASRLRSLLFAAVIEESKPRKILEVGSGNGINLLMLAGVFPDISFTGLELTQAGIDAAQSVQAQTALPTRLADYIPLPQADPLAFKRIDFIRGDATAMPFEDGSFDLVFTVLAVEQMERVRHKALAEIGRVTKRHLLMLEPFRDVNSTGLRRLYVLSRNYFRGSIAELGDFGMTPVWATDDFPQEAFLGSALVLSEKRPA